MARPTYSSTEGRDDRRSRLTLEISPDLRQRIQAAAERDMLSVPAYVEHVLEDAVSRDAPLPHQENRAMTAHSVERLLQVRETVMRDRHFTDDSAELLREARDERLTRQ